MATIIVDKPSFSYGEIAQQFTSDSRSKVYQKGCYYITNGYITQRGSVRKRRALRFVNTFPGVSNISENTALRIFFYKDSRDRVWIFLFIEGETEIKTFRLNTDNTIVAVSFESRRAYEINAPEFDPQLNPFTFTRDFIENMQHAIQEDLIAFVHNSVPPFFFSSVSEGLVFLNSLAQLSMFYNPGIRNNLGELDNNIYYKKLYQSYPFLSTNDRMLVRRAVSVVITTENRGTLGLDNIFGYGLNIKPTVSTPRGYSGNPDFTYVSSLPYIANNQRIARSIPRDQLVVVQDLSLPDTMASPRALLYNYIYIEPGPTTNYSRSAKGEPFLNVSGEYYSLTPHEVMTTTAGVATTTSYIGPTSDSFIPGGEGVGQVFVQEWEPGDFPRAVTFYENRLILASTKKSPQKIWFSEVNAPSKFFDFDVYIAGRNPVTAVSPGSFRISDNQEFEVKRLFSQDALFIGTDESVFTSQGTDPASSVPFSYGFINNFRQPASSSPMASSGDYVYFLGSDRKKLYRSGYKREIQKYSVEDMSVFFGDFGGNLRLLGFDQEARVSVFLKDNNELIFFTDEPISDTRGWARTRFPSGVTVLDAIARLRPDRSIAFSFVVEVPGNKIELLEFSFRDPGIFNLDLEREITRAVSEGLVEMDQDFKDRYTLKFNEFREAYRRSPSILSNNRIYTNPRDVPDSAVSIKLGYIVGFSFSPTIPATQTREGSTRYQSQHYKKMYFNIIESGNFTVRNEKEVLKTYETYTYRGEDLILANNILKDINEPITRNHNNRLIIDANNPYNFEIAGISFEGEVNL